MPESFEIGETITVRLPYSGEDINMPQESSFSRSLAYFIDFKFPTDEREAHRFWRIFPQGREQVMVIPQCGDRIALCKGEYAMLRQALDEYFEIDDGNVKTASPAEMTTNSAMKTSDK